MFRHYLPLLACLLSGVVAERPEFTFQELWDLENNFWKQFLYPANVKQINATDGSVFAEDVCLILSLFVVDVSHYA